MRRSTLSMTCVAAALAAAAGAETPPASSARARLEVGWISRDPKLPPPGRIDAPREEGWPEPRGTVRWVAHVLNRGAATVSAVPYTWRLDEETVASGALDLPPGETTVELPWKWTFDRHYVSFTIQPPAEATDASRDDDQVTVASDALALGLWAERSVYDWMLEGGRPGLERFMQREIERWNLILARAVYPTTPAGALDRIRLERVVVLPDGVRPRNDEMDADLHWFIMNESPGRFLQKGASPHMLADQTIILHELLHQRGLTDLYAYHVVHGDITRTDSHIDITENGRQVVGGVLMPAVTSGTAFTVVYQFPVDGLMGTQYRHGANLTEHCANGLNLHAGHRTPRWLDQWGNLIIGYSNAVNPGSYLALLPRRTELTLTDETGAIIAGAAVDVYADHSPDTYQKIYVDRPDRTLTADARGVVVLPGDVLDGLPPTTAPPKSQVIILKVRTERGRAFVFVPVYDLNLLYFREGPERAATTLRVKLHPW